MKMRFVGKAAVIAFVAVCVTAAQAAAASHHHKARRAAAAAQTVRMAAVYPGDLTRVSYLVPATTMPVILGVGF